LKTKKQQIYWLTGLPASGKSVWSRDLVAKSNGTIKRVNKDDLRMMIDAGKWSRERERTINDIQYSMIEMFLDQGFSVVCDNTNFASEHLRRIKSIVADRPNVELVEKFFDTPLLECIERDSKRGDQAVGKEVIYRMYSQYLQKPNPSNPNGEKAIIWDIDGTLAKMVGRNPFDLSRVKEDIVHKPVFECYKAMKAAGFKTIIFSGRDGVCEEDTKEWLDKNDIQYDYFDMRTAGDNRPDTIVKSELFDKIKHIYNVVFVVDDREAVASQWRNLGLTCFQVDYGMF
jgi:predicted kinase